MIPDLFAHAAPQGAAWPVAAGLPAADAPSDAPAGEFADLLALNLAPEAEHVVTVRPSTAMPLSLADLWLGLTVSLPQEGETADETADAAGEETASADTIAGEGLIAAPAVSVPVDAAPVPVIVQVPTDIMSAAPVPAPSQEASAAEQTNAAAAVVTPQAVPVASEKPRAPESRVPDVQQPSAVIAKDDAGSRAAESPERPMENLSEAPVEAPKAARPSAQQPARTADDSGKTVVADARVEHQADTPRAKADTTTVNVKAESRPAAPPQEAAVQAAGTARQAGHTAGREVSLERESTTPDLQSVTPEQPGTGPDRDVVVRDTAAPAVPAQAARSQQPVQVAAPEAAVAADPAIVRQAAETVAGRVFTARQGDSAPSRDSGPSAEPTTADAEPVMNFVATSPDGGDAPPKDAGKQAASEASFEIAPAARQADVPVAPAPVTPAAEAVRPAAAPQPAAAPIFTPAEETENLGRLVQGMRVQWRQGVPEATVRLNPEHLGEVTIQIRVDRGVVSATFQAENPAVQQWLEAHEDRLRSGLADQGLNLERYTVQRERQQQERRDPRQEQQARYRQPREDQGQRFEVTA